MRKVMITTLMGVALAAPVAHAAHWERQADGSLYCAGSYPAIGASGQTIIVCPPDPVSNEQTDALRKSWLDRQRAEDARMADHEAKEKTVERDSILKTCARPDPSINQAWCADELARLNRH